MGFKTIKKSSAPDLVAQQILEQIENHTLPPGSRLPSQRELAALLGVGRSSLREAVNALVAMGYLEPIQGKGTYIKAALPGKAPNMDKLARAMAMGSAFDLMEARTLMECKSAALAASRADTTQLNRLDATLAQLPTAFDDYETFLALDLEFHTGVAEATNNMVICEMTKLFLEKLRSHHAGLNTGNLSRDYKKISVYTAQKTYKAIKRQDADQARVWMERHLSAIQCELGKLL